MRPASINLGQPINWGHPLNRGLVSRWHVLPQTIGGLRLLDLCGAYHGTRINTPDWSGSAGRLGGYGALNYVSGSSQYVSTSAPFSSLANFTLAGWVQRSAAGSNVYMTTNTADHPGLVQVGFFSDGNVYITPNSTDGSQFLSCASSTTNWLHFVYAYDGSLGSATTRNVLYLNGISQTLSGSSTATSTSASAGTLDIGRRGFSSTYTSGKIDDVRFWTRTLSADEAMRVYMLSMSPFDHTLNYIRRRSANSASATGNRRRRVLC